MSERKITVGAGVMKSRITAKQILRCLKKQVNFFRSSLNAPDSNFSMFTIQEVI